MRCLVRVLACLLPLASAAGFAGEPEPRDDAPPRETAASRVYRMRRNAVVSLRSVSMGSVPARLETNEHGHPKQNLGSGLVIDPRGYVVTCYHVVKDMVRHEAVDAAGERYRVRIVNFDERQDLALLRLESRAGGAAKRFDHVPLWDNEAIVGENAYTIGNPYGLCDSLTVGYVGAVHRPMRMHNSVNFEDLVQIDAGINPGNSGGPVFDVRGQLLGITVAIRREAQCLAFAFPTRVVKEAVAGLMGESPVSAERFGLRLKDVVAARGPLLQVAHVEPNSAAAKQGVREGDTIQTADGEPIASSFDLSRCFWERGPNWPLRLKVGQGAAAGRECTLNPAEPERKSEADVVWKQLGLWLSDVSAERMRGIDGRLEGGLLVRAVAPGRWGDAMGLQVGDVVFGMVPSGGVGRNVKTNADVCWCMQHPAEFPPDRVVCRFARDGEVMPDVSRAFPRFRGGE